MRFNLKRGTPTIPDVDDAGILARWHNDALAAGRKPAQMNARGLIGTMLRPHHRKDAQLDKGGFAAHERPDTFKLFRREIVSGDYFGIDAFYASLITVWISSLITYYFFNRSAQLIHFDAAKLFVNHFAFVVIKKRSRQSAAPIPVHCFD